jgi:drug/metabolite transporter (DMT)-like permease
MTGFLLFLRSCLFLVVHVFRGLERPRYRVTSRGNRPHLTWLAAGALFFYAITMCLTLGGIPSRSLDSHKKAPRFPPPRYKARFRTCPISGHALFGS